MGKTSTEVKQRWENKTYSRYVVRLRRDTDKPLIDFIEKNKDTLGTSGLFRDALAEYVKQSKKER